MITIYVKYVNIPLLVSKLLTKKHTIAIINDNTLPDYKAELLQHASTILYDVDEYKTDNFHINEKANWMKIHN